MSRKSAISPLDVLSRYAAGYFPLYDMSERFYWERLSIRAIVPVTNETVRQARRLSQRARGRFEIRYNQNLPKVLEHLQDERVKERTWVRREVAEIYRALHGAGVLQTIEAHDAGSGKLSGALVGIVLPGTFIAETMFSLVTEASKVCLCQLVEDAAEAGHRVIDVQTPHHLDETGMPRELSGSTPHPCIRLGECSVTLSTFLRMLRKGWEESFAGTLADWLAVASIVAAASRDARRSRELIGSLDAEQLKAAGPFLKKSFPGVDLG